METLLLESENFVIHIDCQVPYEYTDFGGRQKYNEIPFLNSVSCVHHN